MTHPNPAQIAINAEILAEERRQLAGPDLREEIAWLRREVAELRRRPAFDAEELVEAVKGYCDRAFDDMHSRLDKAAEDASRGDRGLRLAIDEAAAELHRKVDDLGARVKKAIEDPPIPSHRPLNGAGRNVQ